MLEQLCFSSTGNKVDAPQQWDAVFLTGDYCTFAVVSTEGCVPYPYNAFALVVVVFQEALYGWGDVPPGSWCPVGGEHDDEPASGVVSEVYTTVGFYDPACCS